MNFTGKRAPVVAVIILIWLALMGLAVANQFVLAQTSTSDNGGVGVAGITPTATSPSPSATPTTPGVPPATGGDVSIPEPATITLMGLGLAGLAGYLKRRRS